MEKESLFQSPEEAHELMHKLTEYFGERVCRASDHCAALLEWVRIVGKEYDPRVAEAWAMVQIPLLKSNLAARLVYAGEAPRTDPCPIHKGHWSGCVFGPKACPEGCMSGSNVTGWLQPSHEFVEQPEIDARELAYYAERYEGFDPSNRCRKCGGERDKPLHKVEEKA